MEAEGSEVKVEEVGVKVEVKVEEEDDDGGVGGGAGDFAETRSFACGKCGQTLELTPVDILKHRRSCGK